MFANDLMASELFSVKGQKVFLTGASGYLGRCMSKALLANGAELILVGHSDRFNTFVKTLRENYRNTQIHSYQVDMRNLPSFKEILEKIYQQHSKLDVIVNNAHPMALSSGFNTSEGVLEKASLEQVSHNITGAIYWPLLTVQILGRRMVENKGGSIINIATMYSEIAPCPQLYEGTNYLNPVGYSVSKAGMMAFTRYVASFWGRHGIRSNAILPGAFPNIEDSTENAVKQNDFFIERLKQKSCLGRVANAQELIGTLLFLASDASSFVTGHGICVDGGWSIT